jgi:hypothetical protein
MMVEQSRVDDSKKLREENARLNLEVGSLINENRAVWIQAEAAAAVVERIRTFVHQASEVVAKVELFDEKVGIGSKPSGTRIAMILTDYSEKLERVLADMRDGGKPGHRPAETAGATGSDSVKLQGASDPPQAVFSG